AEAAARYAVEHPDYPPLNPALQLLTYVVAGDMLHFVARLPMQLSGSAIALGVYGAVATAAGGRAGGVAGALAVAALLGQEWFRVAAQSGMSDGMVAAGLLLAAAWWASWRDGRRRRDAACAALMTAFLASSKHEGALLATLLGLVVLAAELRARGRDALRSVAVLAPLSALVPPAAHVACLRRLGASNDMVEGLAAPDRAATAVARIPEVAALTWERLVSLSEAGGALVVAAPIVALLAARRGASSAVLIGAWTAALGGAAYFAVFLLTPRELRWHFESAAPRLCGHLVPTALVALATAACAAAGTRGDARAPAATVEAD
ncbi:MAG TPA: hypothetical protein VEI02_00260, partial [Planctomycetota bacterium]|nr:hypothetical protein [Planctomycetota bacterium]